VITSTNTNDAPIVGSYQEGAKSDPSETITLAFKILASHTLEAMDVQCTPQGKLE
jgi:hypothetical protein